MMNEAGGFGESGGQISTPGVSSEIPENQTAEKQEIPLGLPVSPEEFQRLKRQAEVSSSSPTEAGEDEGISPDRN